MCCVNRWPIDGMTIAISSFRIPFSSVLIVIVVFHHKEFPYSHTVWLFFQSSKAIRKRKKLKSKKALRERKAKILFPLLFDCRAAGKEFDRWFTTKLINFLPRHLLSGCRTNLPNTKTCALQMIEISSFFRKPAEKSTKIEFD